MGKLSALVRAEFLLFLTIIYRQCTCSLSYVEPLARIAALGIVLVMMFAYTSSVSSVREEGPRWELSHGIVY